MLVVQAVHHRYDERPILAGIDLTLTQGEILCLLGASGSGKSTLLRVIAGLEPLQQGRIEFAGQTLAIPGDEPPAEARGFGLVFQDHVLFPHMTIADNVAFGLSDVPIAERHERIAEQLNAVGLAAFAKRFPHTLSGGQQQRVALARALAPQPRLMLLDEPFASVDSTLRRQLREDTRRALRSAGVSAIVVTHDAQEAMELADRIAVIHDGVLVQLGTPLEVWQAPRNAFIAELFNNTRAISGMLQNDRLQTAFGHVPRPALGSLTGLDEGPCEVVIRPQAMTLEADPSSPVGVEDIRCLGAEYVVTLYTGEERLRVAAKNAPSVVIGERVAVDFDSTGVLVYRP